MTPKGIYDSINQFSKWYIKARLACAIERDPIVHYVFVVKGFKDQVVWLSSTHLQVNNIQSCALFPYNVIMYIHQKCNMQSSQCYIANCDGK